MVALLGHSSPSVVTPALRTIGNVVSGDDAQTQAVVDAGGLQAVRPLLAHAKKGIRKEACWMLSNVAAGSKDQIASLLTYVAQLRGRCPAAPLLAGRASLSTLPRRCCG
jgi:hypothetical protein